MNCEESSARGSRRTPRESRSGMTKAEKFEAYLELRNACYPARDWARGKTLRQAWRQCTRPAWLLWMVTAVEFPHASSVCLRAYCWETLREFVLSLNVKVDADFFLFLIDDNWPLFGRDTICDKIRTRFPLPEKVEGAE